MWMWCSSPSTIPVVSIFISISPLKVSMWQSWWQTSLRGGPSSGSCPKRYGRQRSRSSSWHALTTSQKHMPTCHCLQLTSPHWPRLPTPRPLTWSWRQQLNWWFRSTSWSITWVLVQDPPPKTTAEECLSQLRKVLLPQPSSLTQEPQYRPTRLLAAVVWLHLKCKFFNGSTAKDACTTFEVQAKQLSKAVVRDGLPWWIHRSCQGQM